MSGDQVAPVLSCSPGSARPAADETLVFYYRIVRTVEFVSTQGIAVGEGTGDVRNLQTCNLHRIGRASRDGECQ